MILSKSIKFLLAPPDDDGGGDPDPNDKTPPAIDKSEAAKQFFARFSASNNAPPDLGGDITNKPNKDTIEAVKENDRKLAEEREQQRQEAQKIGERAGAEGKKPPFVKQQIERARTAEQERDELKGKVTEYETKLADTEKKIAEYQAKIDSGDLTPKKEAELEQKVAELELKAKEEKDALVNENTKLKSRLSYYDLAEDENFVAEYVKPVEESYAEATDVLKDDQQRKAMQQALLANSAALRATTPEERSRAEAMRDEILSGIVDGLNQFAGSRFTNAINRYITGSHKHAKALSEWQATSQQVRAKAKEKQTQAYAQRLQTWDSTYKSMAKTYEQEETLTPEEIKLAKELGFDVDSDLKKMSAVAAKTISGESSMEDAIALVHKGRIYPALKAKAAVLEKELSEARELITKLRGGGTKGGESQGGSPQRSGQKQTREEWQQKFAAGRVS